MTASVVGHADVAQLLLEAGAQKDVRDNQGGTALMLAAQFRSRPSCAAIARGRLSCWP